jgi:hypothetical protein
MTFMLDNQGARGDAKQDDRLVSSKAWNAACSYSCPAVLLFPNGKSYLLEAIILSSPPRFSILSRYHSFLFCK